MGRKSYLISILLPIVRDGGTASVPQSPHLYQQVATELTAKFGGLTAHTRAPAQGLWQPASDAARSAVERDDIVIYEVMVDDLDRRWWREYRAELERRFAQELVVIRAEEIELL